MASSILKAVGADIVTSLPEIIAESINAPDQYEGLKAVGYGLTKTAPWIDVLNEYPEAHPDYDPSKETQEDGYPAEVVEDAKVPEETKLPDSEERAIVEHTAPPITQPVISQTVTSKPASATYTLRDDQPLSRMIRNPFTDSLITFNELVRLSKKNDAEGLWAKRTLKKYKVKYNSNKRVLLQ